MKTQRFLIAVLLILSQFLVVSCGSEQVGHEVHDDHAGEHQDESHNAHSGDNEHDEDDDHVGHDEHSENVVKLTVEQLRENGVVIMPLGGGEISTKIMLPAEIGLNEDAVVHVTPRVSGIVTHVSGFLGQEVVAGDVLAVLESPELGEAKIEYLQMMQAKQIASDELHRQETISKNTAKLLKVLSRGPSVDDLHQEVSGLRIGLNKGRLLSAYAQMKLGSSRYVIEQELDDKGLTTKAELVAAQELYISTQGQYMAVYEEVDFSFRVKLQEVQQTLVVATTAAKNSERRLSLFGLTQEQIKQVSVESDRNIARYELVAPTNGRLVSKHITPGEKVGSDSSVYTIADMRTVWVNISIYSQYAESIEAGQRVTVRVGNQTATGVVEYISAIVSDSTRTFAARVVLDNTDDVWKPGIFVTAHIETESSFAKRIVPMNAVQTFGGYTVVFMQGDDGIEPVQVALGRKNDEHVELLGDDIALGALVVVENSFLMKAELGKSSAGHQH